MVVEPTLELRLAVRNRPQDRSPVMYQTWSELLFLHWRYDPDTIQKTLPPGLTVDTFEGRAYVGIVPFYMRNIRPRFLPALPGISNFLELNVRTYVFDKHGRPGVWFYSLDANQWLAVLVARNFFQLPYFYSKMSASTNSQNSEVLYSCRRGRESFQPEAQFRYRPIGAESVATPGTLEFFLIERYLLFAYLERSKRLYSGQVIHTPYQLRGVEVSRYTDSPLSLVGLMSPDQAPEHQIYSAGVAVDIFSLVPVEFTVS